MKHKKSKRKYKMIRVTADVHLLIKQNKTNSKQSFNNLLYSVFLKNNKKPKNNRRK